MVAEQGIFDNRLPRSHRLRIPEHTWGLLIEDLKHWDVYEMDAFRSVRNLPDFKVMEQSWAEKRANLGDAIRSLPPGLAAEAKVRVEALRPLRTERQDFHGVNSPRASWETKHFRIGFDPKTGAINFLEHRETKRQWAGPKQCLGLFSYQTFSQPDFDRFVKQYVPLKPVPEWAINSWEKPGLEKTSAKSALYMSTLKQLWFQDRKDGQLFLAELEVPEAGDSGCPREITVETFLPEDEPSVKVALKWFNKPASRLPEAPWFSFIPPVFEGGQFEMDKMGQAVSPLNVVRDGNRNLHGIITGVTYQDKKSSFQLETLDAFLVAPGRPSLLIFDNRQPEMTGGMHFCL